MKQRSQEEQIELLKFHISVLEKENIKNTIYKRYADNTIISLVRKNMDLEDEVGGMYEDLAGVSL